MFGAYHVRLNYGGLLVTTLPTGKEHTWSEEVTAEFVRLLSRPTPASTRSFVLGSGKRDALAVTLAPSGAVNLRLMWGPLTREAWTVSHVRVMEMRLELGLLEPRGNEPLSAAMTAQLQTWGSVKTREQIIGADAWRAGALARLYELERPGSDADLCWCGRFMPDDFAGYRYCPDDGDEHREREMDLKRGGRLTRSVTIERL